MGCPPAWPLRVPLRPGRNREPRWCASGPPMIGLPKRRRRPHDRAVRERPRERSPRPAPADKAHRTVLRGNVLNDCGEPVSVALGMATVDPEAPASRVVSDPAQVRAQRRRSPVAGPEPRYHYHYPAVPSRSCDEPARPPRETRRFTQGADLPKRRGGRWVREFDSRKRDHGCSLRLMLFGVGAPDAQGDGGAADGVSAGRWLRRNGRPVALARRPWVHRCR
jgi:hypothetical protein